MTKKRVAFKFLGFVFCIVPPILATFDQFPVMNVQKKVSFLFLILFVASLVPIIKYIKKAFESPSAWMMWGVLLLFSIFMRVIASEFYTVALIGFIGSIIGAVFFNLAKRGEG